MTVEVGVSAGQLRLMLQDSAEVVLLDVREEGLFGKEHLLYASCAPLGRLEKILPVLVPRKSCRVVFCEDGDALAVRAAQLARRLGYVSAYALDGGHTAAQAQGFELFSGVNVPSKAFGEFIESTCETPSISADELHQALESNEDLVILDSRPFAEYTVRNIPGGINCPGAELVYRVNAIAPQPVTRVIVNCAGRTRSIIGAQSLINAGIPNTVMALRNGTMGWHLAGHRLEEGAQRIAPEVSGAALKKAQCTAGRVATRYHVQAIDREGLQQWQRQSQQRTLYVFDVRHPEEYQSGHLSGSRCAPGGQLVQETEQFMATLGARVVLVDDDGVRANMTASWLLQMGWCEVRVLSPGLGSEDNLLQGKEAFPDCLGLENITVQYLSVDELKALIVASQTRIYDVSHSTNYRHGHLPGAVNLLRSELAAALADDNADFKVVTSEDGDLGALAVRDLNPAAQVWVLRGGNRAWGEAGGAVETGPGRRLSPAVDRYQRPYEKDWGNEQAMHDYLNWEVELVPKLERDGTAMFLTEV